MVATLHRERLNYNICDINECLLLFIFYPKFLHMRSMGFSLKFLEACKKKADGIENDT